MIQVNNMIEIDLTADNDYPLIRNFRVCELKNHMHRLIARGK